MSLEQTPTVVPTHFPPRCSKLLTPFALQHKALEQLSQPLSRSTVRTKLWLRCHHRVHDETWVHCETCPAAGGTAHPRKTRDKHVALAAFPQPCLSREASVSEHVGMAFAE